MSTILIPGWMHEHARDVLSRRFKLIEIDQADAVPALAEDQRRAILGIACRAGISAETMQALPNLQIIASFGVGYDMIDIAGARARGVVVTNTPDVLNEEVADTSVGLLLNVVRDLSRAEAYVRAGQWEHADYPLSRLTLRERVVGIYGMGRIGQCIARRLEAFGVGICYHNRQEAPDLPYRYFASLMEMAAHVDTLISIVPGTPSTALTINGAVLAALGPDGVFINMGRGSVVDEAALLAALRSGTIAAAGLDVFANEPHIDKELLALPNLTVLPHIGSASHHTRRAMGDLVARNLITWFETGRALTPVC